SSSARAGPCTRSTSGARTCTGRASTYAPGGRRRRLGWWRPTRSAARPAAALGVIEHLLGFAATLGLGRDRDRPVEGVLGLLFGAHLLVEVEPEERHEAVHHVGRERSDP